MTSMNLEPGNSYLFDTTVFIDVLRKHEAARKLFYQARFYPVSVGYSIITEAELWAGISEHKFRTVPQHTALLKPFRRYFINVTIARRAGELRRLLAESGAVKKEQGPHLPDCIIAATAEYYHLTVCSRDSGHFRLFGQFSISVLEYS